MILDYSYSEPPHEPAAEKLNIAVDFDGTFTANTALFCQLVGSMLKYGADVRIVTFRFRQVITATLLTGANDLMCRSFSPKVSRKKHSAKRSAGNLTSGLMMIRASSLSFQISKAWRAVAGLTARNNALFEK